MTTASEQVESAAPAGLGYWEETWLRFRRRLLSYGALIFIGILILVALFAPAIVGTRPIVCYYQGWVYVPALAYFYERWEPVVFLEAPFNEVYYPKGLETDPNSWAVWPLIYQDPRRPIYADEWPGLPANPQYSPPTEHNLMGTNNVGIDVFAMLVHGTRIALLVGFVATGISALIGITVGAIAGYPYDINVDEWWWLPYPLRKMLGFLASHGVRDILLSRIIEVVMCVPTLVLILAMLGIIERASIWLVMVVIGLTSWTSMARLTRGEFLKLGTLDYVLAARALGAGDLRIIFVHMLPNAMAPVMVPITFGIASSILLESSLSFLGFGAQPDDPSWGTVIKGGQGNPQMWWLILFPGIAIFLSVLAYNLIGEGVQEATDPRLREAGK